MDKELPWLADNAQLELKYKKGKTPLSHRKWPGGTICGVLQKGILRLPKTYSPIIPRCLTESEISLHARP